MQAKSKNAADDSDLKSSGPSELLRQTRKDRGLSVDEVAHHLHLSPEVVLALEAGDFDMLGAAVFVKGHLRSYARFLELPEDDVVIGYRPPEPEPEEFRTLSMRSEVRPAASLPNFVLMVLLGVIVLVGTVYLLLDNGGDERQSDFEETAAVAPARTDKPDEENAVAATDKVAEEPVGRRDSDFEPAVPPVVKQPVAPAESQAVPAAAAEPEVELPAEVEPSTAEVTEPVAITFRFLDECWVEVSDSRRRRIYGLKKPGSESNFRGVLPLKVFLGNAAAVEIEVGGRAVAIPAASRRGGKTARFTIDNDDL